MGERTLREVLKRRSEETVRKIQAARGRGGKPRRRTSWTSRLITLAVFLFLVVVAAGGWLAYDLNQAFAVKSFAPPAKVFAKPIELQPGFVAGRNMVLAELQRLGYKEDSSLQVPGTFSITDAAVRIHSRSFNFWDGVQPELKVEIRFTGNRVSEIRQIPGGRNILALRLDPLLIGNIHPLEGTDTIHVEREDVPEYLLNLLFAAYDPEFETHFGFGVDDTAFEKDGHTLTQRVVDDVTRGDSASALQGFRKLVGTLVLESGHSKKKILNAFLNEVRLGRTDGEPLRGFGLASYHYFQMPLSELELHEITTLVAMVGHADELDPRLDPDAVRERRNALLDFAYASDLMSRDEVGKAFQQPLNVSETAPVGTSFFPAFMAALKDQLKADFDAYEIGAPGLRIFSTLDTFAQHQAEAILSAELTRIEAANNMSRSLQAALVVVDPRNGNVQAVVGGRDSRRTGVNRAVSAVRPVGTLVLPAVYMGALEKPDRYTWATPVEDRPIEVGLPDGSVWQPVNRGNQYAGTIRMLDAFVNAKYSATVRMGLEVGVSPAVQNMRRWGFGRAPNPYPGILLGNFDMSPVEVAHVYATLGNGGVRHQLNTIEVVVRDDGNALDRFSDEPVEVMDRGSSYLLNFGMQESALRGVAAGLRNFLGPSFNVAVQTGNTQTLADSWFAGYSGDRAVVVWVGRDDGEPVGLTGEAGAMPIWARLMSRIALQGVNAEVPEGVEIAWIDARGHRFAPDCGQGRPMPFFVGSAPDELVACDTPPPESSEQEATPIYQ